MIISAYFADDGEPKTGLTPTVTVYDLSDNSKAVDAASMSEVGGGFYKYDFIGFDSSKDYTVICDGGATLSGSERYCVAGSDVQGIAKQTLADTNELQTDWADGGRLDLLLDDAAAGSGGGSSFDHTVDEVIVGAIKTDALTGKDDLKADVSALAIEASVQGVKTVTDNLPDSGALTTLITHLTDIKGAGWTNENLTTLDALIDAIKAATDNLPSDPADASDIDAAITAAIASIKGGSKTIQTISTELGVHDGNLATVDMNVDAIKAKTDNLPLDTAQELNDIDNALAGKALEATAQGIKSKTDNLPTDPADQSQLETFISGEHATLNTKVDTLQGTASAIRSKTDNLPTDPADQSLVEAKISNTESNIRGGAKQLQDISEEIAALEAAGDYSTELTNIQNTATAIRAKTDGLPVDTETELDAIDSNLAKLDVIDGNVDAIKLKTDNLPADPASQASVDASVSASEGVVTARVDTAETNLTAEIDSVQMVVDFLKDATQGRWKIDESTSQMIFYKADNTTEIMRFDLKDKLGTPAVAAVFERVKV